MAGERAYWHMAKYKAEAQEKAYDLKMIQQFSFLEVWKRMREEYPTFSKGTLTKWMNDPNLDWEERYNKYCRALATKNDEKRVKQIVPIVTAIEDIRDKVYNNLVTFLGTENVVITEKNIGLVLSSFVKMGDLEYKIKGGSHSTTPVKQVINVLIMVLEKNPNVGPVIKAHKQEIEEAIFEEIKRGS